MSYARFMHFWPTSGPAPVPAPEGATYDLITRDEIVRLLTSFGGGSWQEWLDRIERQGYRIVKVRS